MLVSYNYNSQVPFLYSKWFARANPGSMNVSMPIAVGGTSAAPLYFKPQSTIDKYEMQNLVIDGGIVANNPSFFAYMIATHLHKKDKVRIISLSTGIDHYDPDITEFNGINYLKLLGEFVNTID